MPMILSVADNDFNPAYAFKATFDSFYELIKKEVAGNLNSNQYIQLRLAATPFGASTESEWFTRYGFLTAVDRSLEPRPLTDGLNDSDRKMSNEYGEFLQNALRVAQRDQNNPDVLRKIDELNVEIANINVSYEKSTLTPGRVTAFARESNPEIVPGISSGQTLGGTGIELKIFVCKKCSWRLK